MASTFLRLLVVLLGFSHLICLNAVPVTRTRSLMHEYQGHDVLQNTHLANEERSWELQSTTGRMNLQLNDYPGYGANNRHTPTNPQPARSCGDC